MTVGLQRGNILVRSMKAFPVFPDWHWIRGHKSHGSSSPHNAKLGMLFQEHREKHLDVALVLLQGKHPHYPQSSSVVTQVCYNPTKPGNLPVHAENRVISKPKPPSCGWELGGAPDLCWLLTPLDKDLLLSN